MAKLNVTLLDMQRTAYLSAEQLELGDERHDKKDSNTRMLDCFHLHGTLKEVD
jgi:hypothetical protein